MSRKPLTILAALVAVVALLGAACGSSKSDSGSGTPKGTTNPATGTPILVGQIAGLTGPVTATPEAGTSMVASIDALNDSGGINGHPLKLEQCDSKGDPSTEIECAKKMVNDKVVATLGDGTFYSSTQTQQIFSDAGIPRIGITAADPSEYQAMTNFDFTGGGVFSLIGLMDALINQGKTKISIMIPDSPQSQQTHLLVDPIAQAQGAEVVNYVLVSSASGDYSQYVTQATQNGAEGVVVALGNAQIVQVAQAINQLSPNIQVSTGIAGFSLDQLKQLGSFATNASYAWWEPGIDDTKNFPGLQEPLDQLTTYMKGASVNTLTSVSLASWLTVHAFSEVMKTQTTDPPTAASVLAAFKAAKDIPMNDIIKPWTPSAYVSAGSLSSIFANVSNPWMYNIKYDGSSSSSSPSDVFDTFAGLPGTTSTTGG
ncbi:MAG: ABC transporter substrate-binding protein [Acidimicrobiales bacterium]